MLPHFTIGQILLVMVAVGCGLAVARLPQGGLIDFVLVAVGSALGGSLLRRLLANLNSLHEVAPAARRSAILLSCLILLTVSALATGTALLYGSAAGSFSYRDAWWDINLLFNEHTVYFMLILLSMQIAIGLGQSRWQTANRQPTPRRFSMLAAVVCLLVALIAYWCNGLIVWLLVYTALIGVDVATPFPSQPLNVTRSAQFFALGTGLGLPLCLLHLALIAGCVQKWHLRKWRMTLKVLLGAVVLAECALILWLAGPGLHALSPHFQESLFVPPWPLTVVTASLVTLFATWFAFRLTARSSESISFLASPESESSLDTRVLFHERFGGALAVALAATGGIIYQLVNLQQLPFTPDWESVLYVLTLPDSLMMFATAIWGFTLAWQRYRSVPCSQELPHIDIAQFATLLFAIASAITLGGPIIAAFTFGLMLFGFGMTR